MVRKSESKSLCSTVLIQHRAWRGGPFVLGNICLVCATAKVGTVCSVELLQLFRFGGTLMFVARSSREWDLGIDPFGGEWVCTAFSLCCFSCRWSWWLLFEGEPLRIGLQNEGSSIHWQWYQGRRLELYSESSAVIIAQARIRSITVNFERGRFLAGAIGLTPDTVDSLPHFPSSTYDLWTNIRSCWAKLFGGHC